MPRRRPRPAEPAGRASVAPPGVLPVRRAPRAGGPAAVALPARPAPAVAPPAPVPLALTPAPSRSCRDGVVRVAVALVALAAVGTLTAARR